MPTLCFFTVHLVSSRWFADNICFRSFLIALHGLDSVTLKIKTTHLCNNLTKWAKGAQKLYHLSLYNSYMEMHILKTLFLFAKFFLFMLHDTVFYIITKLKTWLPPLSHEMYLCSHLWAPGLQNQNSGEHGFLMHRAWKVEPPRESFGLIPWLSGLFEREQSFCCCFCCCWWWT